ncbi:MAG: helix-turn-helix transcriptional regulator [Gammaproteobacteria bacterium]
MVDETGSRQHQILNLLLNRKGGLSIDEIAASVAISRNAVQQHINKLEREGLVEMGALNKTAGRPVRTFVLTEAGVNSFTKQYAWFSGLILADLKEQKGSEVFQRYLHNLACSLSQTFLPKFEGRPANERLSELLKLMNELGFHAGVAEPSTTGRQTIRAINCIYHDLAQKNEEICEFDRALITSLLGKEIDHTECMAKGGSACCFQIRG